MSNILILNGHQPYPFSKGELNRTLVNTAVDVLIEKGHTVRTVETANDYDVQEQVANHQWADSIILQMPVNWMTVPWSLKKYMDDVYTAGMGGELCSGDGRNSDSPTSGYGTGGSLPDTSYMLSLTFNAPKQAFDNPTEYLFEGRGVDDVMLPIHMNFRFFAMKALPTFSCFDVMKNPQIEQDLESFKAHLNAHY